MTGKNLYYTAPMINGMCGLGLMANIIDKTNIPPHYQSQIDYYKARYPTMTLEEGLLNIGFTPFEQGKHMGGAGFVSTGFIPTKVSKETYEALCATRQLVYQSPVRINRNTMNRFFFAIFNDKKDAKDITEITPQWPWEDKDLK